MLGEYTLASFLCPTTFQTALLLVQQTDPYVAAIFAVAALVFGFVLLVLIGRIGSASVAASAVPDQGVRMTIHRTRSPGVARRHRRRRRARSTS